MAARRPFRFARRSREDVGGSTEPVAGADRAQGRSGTVNTRGFITDEEFNSALTWPKNLVVYDRMRKTDATTRWMLALLKGPARAADVAVDPPPNPDDDEREATAFVEHALFEELDGGVSDLLRRLMTYLEMGHSVGERLVELREVSFDVVEEITELVEQPTPPPPPVLPAPAAVDDGEGEPKPAAVPPQLPPPEPPPPKPTRRKETRTVTRDAFVVARVEERLQRTIQRWVPVDGDSAKLKEIEQNIGDGETPNNPTIDASRLIVLVCDKEGDNWRGNSILRSVWRPYEYKSRIENIEAVGFDVAAGVPIAYPPDDADEDQVDAVEEMLQAIVSGESRYGVMPGPKQGENKESRDGWLVDWPAAKGGEAKDGGPDKAINRYVSEMARNVLAEFMRLGQDGVGARATGDVQQDPYYAALEAVVSYLEDVLNEALVRPLVEWNYDVRRFPRLRFAKIAAKSIEVVTKAVAELVKQGAIEPTPELEAWLRDLLDAPEKPKELEDEPRPRPPSTPGRDGTRPAGEGDAPGETGGEAMARERFAQFEPRRPLVGGERFVMWDQVKATLDNGPEDLVAIGERVMGGQIESAASHADEAVRLNRPEDLDRVALDPGPLADALEAELVRLYMAGHADVRAEVRRQLRDAGDEFAIPPRIPLSNADIAKVVGGIAKNMAETAAQSAVRAIKQRALKTIAQRRETPPVPGEDPLAALRASLRAGATPAVNRIYTLGRMDELQSLAHAGDVDALRYSAVLDAVTCSTCASWDGTVVKPELAIPLPNAECDGGDRCRCQWVAETVAPGELDLV